MPGRKRIFESGIANVYLAGDYTDPDYPPTLEAAVRSGIRAAESAFASLSSSPKVAR